MRFTEFAFQFLETRAGGARGLSSALRDVRTKFAARFLYLAVSKMRCATAGRAS